MKKIIKSKEIKITEKLKEYINSKVDSLEKFIKISENEGGRKTLKEIVIEVEKETGKHHEKGFIFKTKMIIHLPGKTLYSESVSENLNLSILEAKEELQREIKRYKSKKIAVRRRKEREIKKEIKLASEARTYRKGRIKEEGL